jgi:hypothetical protein
MKNKVYWTIISSHQMFKTVIEVPVIIDNRVFGRAVKKISLEDFGLQV